MLKAVKFGSKLYWELVRAGWLTHHVDGQIIWMEVPKVAPSVSGTGE